jgi:hypothetical protein
MVTALNIMTSKYVLSSLIVSLHQWFKTTHWTLRFTSLRSLATLHQVITICQSCSQSFALVLKVLGVGVAWGIHLVTPKALKILTFSTYNLEDFEGFWCNEIDTPGHQGIEMATPMNIMICR